LARQSGDKLNGKSKTSLAQLSQGNPARALLTEQTPFFSPDLSLLSLNIANVYGFLFFSSGKHPTRHITRMFKSLSSPVYKHALSNTHFATIMP
jgi:hypothetical protein